MKHIKLILLTALCSVLLLGGCGSQTHSGSGASATGNLFTVTAEPMQITQDKSGTNCIKFSLHIDNASDQELKGVSYSYEFNKEAEEALGGIPLTFPASDPMDVTTKEKANGDAASDQPAIWGFEFSQSIEIPEGTDLSSLKEAFQELTVHITWDNTEQTVSVPLKWNE